MEEEDEEEEGENLMSSSFIQLTKKPLNCPYFDRPYMLIVRFLYG